MRLLRKKPSSNCEQVKANVCIENFQTVSRGVTLFKWSENHEIADILGLNEKTISTYKLLINKAKCN
jgi:hypothetical protein